MTAVLERETVLQDQDEDEEEQFSHYADKVSVTAGYVLGTPVEAVCGKVFVPHRNPDRLPLCPKCKAIADALFV